MYTDLIGAAALVATTLAFMDRSVLPPSSPRKTINFGPTVQTRSGSLYSSSAEDVAALAAANERLQEDLLQAAEYEGIPSSYTRQPPDDTVYISWVGRYVAEAFLRSHVRKRAIEIDPDERWSEQSLFDIGRTYFSSHSKVGHFYAVQSINSRALEAQVGNAFASVHVDLDPSSPRFGHVLSYSESAHKGPLHSAYHDGLVNWHHVAELDPEWASREQGWKDSCSKWALREQNWQDLCLEWASPACKVSATEGREEHATKATAHSAIGQQSFSFDSQTAANPCDEHAASEDRHVQYGKMVGRCVARAESAHIDQDERYAPARHPVGPRLALLSLLSVIGDSDTLAHLASSSADNLIEAMDVESDFEYSAWLGSLGVHVHNVPGSIILDDAPKGRPVKAQLQWLSVPSPSKDADKEEERVLQLVWRFNYRSNLNWYDAHVDATRPNLIVSVIDWVKDFRPPTEVADDPEEHYAMLQSLRETLSSASYAELYPRKPTAAVRTAAKPAHPLNATYKFAPRSVNDPPEGEREVIYAPHHPIASKAGWHHIPPAHSERMRARTGLTDSKDWINEPGWSTETALGMNLTDTRGNNVFAQENWEGYGRWENNGRPDGSANLTFDFDLHWGSRENMSSKHIDPKSYVNASVTQLFYICNKLHDLFYLYGFDERAGNFQEYEFGNGWFGGDAVIANSQDGSGYNNANFATPPNGQHPQMRMYIWNGTHPWRNGDLEAEIAIHQYVHGVSSRLTGGPVNSGCLALGESGGLGQGWSDFVVMLIRMNHKQAQEFRMGDWVSRTAGGIRKHEYSLNRATKPKTYKDLDDPAYSGVHAIGEVWAEMLHTVAETLIKKHGFEPSLFPPLDDESSSEFYTISAKTGKRYPAKGNTLMLQLVVDGMKLQPCRPTFTDARDAIIQADGILTDGENACDIWEAFASHGLGPKAVLKGSTPSGRGTREEDHCVPEKCRQSK